MKVLTVLHSLAIGGIEKTLFHCLPTLQTEGVHMTICCFGKDGNMENDYRSQGVDVVYIKKTGSFLLDFIQLSRILKQGDYDIVHSRLSYTSGGFAMACKIVEVPFILSIHNEFPATLIKWAKRPVFAQIRKLYLSVHMTLSKRLSSLIVGHSRSNLDRNFPHWENSHRYKVLYNGVDFEYLDRDQSEKFNSGHIQHYIKGFGEDAFVLIHIGTFKEQKNHLFMIECFSRLDPVKNNFHLVLLGDGELRAEITGKINQLGLNSNIHLIGFTKDVGSWLRHSDLFFFPSKFEGFANVIIEAQYLEVPICASGIKPHFESVHPFYHPYFFSPSDINDGVQKLQNMVNEINRGNIQLMKADIKENMAASFSIQQMAKRLAEIYYSLDKD